MKINKRKHKLEINGPLETEPANTEDDSAPTPKFKCNDEVRKILYDIIQSEEQSIHIAKLVA